MDILLISILTVQSTAEKLHTSVFKRITEKFLKL